MLRNTLWGGTLLVSAVFMAFVAGTARSDTPKGWRADKADLRSDVVQTKHVVRMSPNTKECGFAWLEGTPFREGTIEVQLKGHGVIGIAFGDVGGKGPEQILFETDNADHIRSISYAAPVGKNGARADATSVVRSNAQPREWCAVKIEVEPMKVHVFLDGSTESAFTAPRVDKSSPSRTGLSVQPGGTVSFADFKVTPLDDATTPKTTLPEKRSIK
jgi:hypothetical protein